MIVHSHSDNIRFYFLGHKKPFQKLLYFDASSVPPVVCDTIPELPLPVHFPLPLEPPCALVLFHPAPEAKLPESVDSIAPLQAPSSCLHLYLHFLGLEQLMKLWKLHIHQITVYKVLNLRIVPSYIRDQGSSSWDIIVLPRYHIVVKSCF